MKWINTITITILIAANIILLYFIFDNKDMKELQMRQIAIDNMQYEIDILQKDIDTQFGTIQELREENFELQKKLLGLEQFDKLIKLLEDFDNDTSN